MEGAVRLGSIRVAAAVDNPERRQAFEDTMRDIVSDILKESVGVRLAWPNPPYPAPGHERLTIPKTDARPRIPRTRTRGKPKPNLRSRVQH